MHSLFCHEQTRINRVGRTATLVPIFRCVFNSAVKNSVENPVVTKVIMRECDVFHALHWIGCEYELLVKFCVLSPSDRDAETSRRQLKIYLYV